MRRFLIVALCLATACGTDEGVTTPATPDAMPDATGPDGSNRDAGDAAKTPDASDEADGRQQDSAAEGDARSSDTSTEESDGGPADSGSEAETSTEAEAAACTSWSSWSDGLSGGNIADVQFDPRTPGVAYATANFQLYRSANSGQTWSLVTNHTGAAITHLEFPPGNANVLLAATSDGLRRSDDGGQTWTIRSLAGIPLTALMVDRTSPQRIFVAGDQGLLMRSNDGGATWRAAASGVPFGQLTSLTGDPTNPDNVVASLIQEDGNGNWLSTGAVVRSTNGGMSWSVALTVQGYVGPVSQCAANPKVMYASTALGISKSTDGGATWGPLLLGIYTNDVGVDPANCDHLSAAIFPAGIVKSTDGGATWSAPIKQGLTLQDGFQYATQLSVDPNNGATILAATHGGIFRSTNSADNWSAAPGIASVLFRDLGVSPTAPQELWMASWGTGAWRLPTPGGTWQRVPLTTLPREWLFTVYPDTFVDGRVLAGTFLGGNEAWRSIDHGSTFTATNGTSNPFSFATDPTDHSVIYMGTQVAGVFKSVDGGATWQPSNVGATDAFVLSILIDPTDSRIVTIGTQNSGIFRSTDAGAHWSPTAMGLGTGAVGSLVRFGGALYAWVDGGGVYRSQDGMAWSRSNSGLEALTTGGIVVDTVAPRLFAVAGSAVYTSNDGSSWQPFDKGCPPPAGGTRPVIVANGATRYIVFGAVTNGVLAHRL